MRGKRELVPCAGPSSWIVDRGSIHGPGDDEPVEVTCLARVDEHMVRFIVEERAEPSPLGSVGIGVASPEGRFEGFEPTPGRYWRAE